MEKYLGIDKNSAHMGSVYLQRPRVEKLLETAMNFPIAVVCAGSGYGKTRAVYAFLQNIEAQSIWVPISARDNTPTRFWESYTDMVSLSLPETGARMQKIGFPDTEEAFAQYTDIMREVALKPGKHISVFDDFHELNNPAVLRFFEMAVRVIPKNVTLVIISRTMPEINLIGMILSECIFTISEEALCFTEEEITEYFEQSNLNVTTLKVRDVLEDTQGWAFAINLIGRSLRKETKYERCALEAMKANIFRLIEAELRETISEDLRRFLICLSLIEHLAATLIKELAGNDKLIKEMESLNAYIRYDLSMDTYMIHHLLLEYLRQNQHMLAVQEKRRICKTAGQWCDANGYHMDAFSYYEKAEDYDAIAHKIGLWNVQIPHDMAQYVLEMFENAPDEAKFGNSFFSAMHIKIRINIGKFDEDTVALTKKYAEHYEDMEDSPEKDRALTGIYCLWVFLSMFMCTYTDKYDFNIYHKKMCECYDRNPFKPIGAYKLVPICAWASLVGTSRAGAQEEYITELSKLVPEVAKRGNGFFMGFDDLARGELCFFKGKFEEAEQYLKQAVDKAQAYDQYVTLSRALAYLMRIAFFRGDLQTATEKLQIMESMLSDKDHGDRYILYDIARGFYLLSVGQSERIAGWLKEDFSPYAHPSFIENYANRIKVQYHCKTGKYSAVLAFIENEMEQTILFGKVELKILEALTFYKLKRRNEAMAAFTQAYTLSAPNDLIVMFTQYSKDMRTLTACALRESLPSIPKPWLEGVNRKASAYAKRQAHMIAQYNCANNVDEKIALTEREKLILKDLSHGLSRSEIAASQNISLSTVKMVINIIYDKLCVTNLPDAIRIGVGKKIV